MPVMKSAPKGDANRHNKLAAKWSTLQGGPGDTGCAWKSAGAHAHRQGLLAPKVLPPALKIQQAHLPVARALHSSRWGFLALWGAVPALQLQSHHLHHNDLLDPQVQTQAW